MIDDMLGFRDSTSRLIDWLNAGAGACASVGEATRGQLGKVLQLAAIGASAWIFPTAMTAALRMCSCFIAAASDATALSAPGPIKPRAAAALRRTTISSSLRASVSMGTAAVA